MYLIKNINCCQTAQVISDLMIWVCEDKYVNRLIQSFSSWSPSDTQGCSDAPVWKTEATFQPICKNCNLVLCTILGLFIEFHCSVDNVATFKNMVLIKIQREEVTFRHTGKFYWGVSAHPNHRNHFQWVKMHFNRVLSTTCLTRHLQLLIKISPSREVNIRKLLLL